MTEEHPSNSHYDQKHDNNRYHYYEIVLIEI